MAIGFFFLAGCQQVIAPMSLVPAMPSHPWKPTKEYKKKTISSVSVDFPKIKEQEAFSLADLVDVALSYHPQTQTSWADAKIAAAKYAGSYASFFPKIDFSSHWQRQRAATSSGGSDRISSFNQTSYGPNVSLNYTLLDFGQRYYTMQSSLQSLYYANLIHNESIQAVIQGVATNYYNYLYQKALYDADKADLANALQSYNAAQKKLEAGIANLSEVLQAKTCYLQTKVSLNRQNTQVKLAYTALLESVGISPSEEIALGAFPEHFDLEEMLGSAEEWVSLAKYLRPDFQAAKSDFLSKEALVREAKSQFYPTVSFVAQGGKAWYPPLGDDGGDYTIGFTFNWNLFDGFYDLNRYRQAEASALKSQIQYYELELEVTRQVIDYLSDYECSKEDIVLSKEYLNSAEEEYTAIATSYEFGTNTILDVLSAQSSLADARSSYVEAKKRLFTSIANLAFATGTLDRYSDHQIILIQEARETKKLQQKRIHEKR